MMLRRLLISALVALTPFAAEAACPVGATCVTASQDVSCNSSGVCTVNSVAGKTLILGGNLTTTGTGAITLGLGNSTATLTFQGTDTYVGRATTDTLTNKTLTSPTINAATLSGTLAGTPTLSGAFTMSGVPKLTGLSSGTIASNLGIDSGNNIVLGTAPGTAAAGTIGTSGATLGLLNANKTDSGNNTFSGTMALTGLSASANGTQPVCMDTSTGALSKGAAGVCGTLHATKTSGYSVLTTDSGTHFDNIGATGAVPFTLPTAAANLGYCFVTSTAQALSVAASGTDTIGFGLLESVPGGNIASNGIYSSVCVEALAAGRWVAVLGGHGSWTVN